MVGFSGENSGIVPFSYQYVHSFLVACTVILQKRVVVRRKPKMQMRRKRRKEKLARSKEKKQVRSRLRTKMWVAIITTSERDSQSSTT